MVLDWNEPAIRLYKSCGETLMTEWTKCGVNEVAIQSLCLQLNNDRSGSIR
jgi:hypothetical protein